MMTGPESRSPHRLPPVPVPGITLHDDDRYESLRLIPWWRQERLEASAVLVVGAGALGNEVLKNLALVGVGRILLIDFDIIEPSNLSRSLLFRRADAGKPKALVAAERLQDLNPEIEILPIHGDVIHDLGLGVFAAVDLVIGCLDNREARLWVNRQCWKVGTPWIDAGIQEIQGVVKVFVPPDSACYECAMTTRDYELLNLRYSCPLLRREDLLQGKVPTAPTIAAFMAALQVQEALKILHDLPVQAGVAHVYSGIGNQFYTTRLPFKNDCLSHEHYPPPIRLDLGYEDTLAELFQALGPHLEGPASLALDRELVTAIEWPQTGESKSILRPRGRVKAGESLDPAGRQGAPVLVSRIPSDGHLASLPMRTLGIPPFDILRVDGSDRSLFVQLERDRFPILKPPRSVTSS
jgi:adenylyltransferase/sulfurtransferase